MKYLRLLSWLLCCTVLMFSLASCEEKEPDLTKKEMDTRLLGTWKQINSNNSENKKLIFSPPLKTIFQHKACIDKLYADSFYKVQKSSHSSFEVICCGS